MNILLCRAAAGFTRTALLCLATAVAGAGLAMVYAQKERGALQAQIVVLREQVGQLEAKSVDAKEVEKLRAQARQVEELKKEAEEVHRLRGEVTQLRQDKGQFEKALVENAQLRAVAQQAQKVQAENAALRGQYQSVVQNMQQQAQMLAANPEQARKNSCIANLKQIDGAIQQWALENRKVAASPVDMRGVVEYLKGSVLPLCPAGGVYRPGPTVSGVPTCTIPGHTL